MDLREKIIEMVNNVKREDILKYIYIMVSDIVKEDTPDDKKG